MITLPIPDEKATLLYGHLPGIRARWAQEFQATNRSTSTNGRFAMHDHARQTNRELAHGSYGMV